MKYLMNQHIVSNPIRPKLDDLEGQAFVISLQVEAPVFVSGAAESGSLLDELNRYGLQAANKLFRRVSQYECPDKQLDKKSWVAQHIQNKWDARRLERSTSMAKAPSRPVRL